MVTLTNYDGWLCGMTLAQQVHQAPIERLDPPTRAAVMMTIFGLVLLGLALVAAIMIGARWVRRQARQRPRPGLADREPAGGAGTHRLRVVLDEENSAPNESETVYVDRKADDTQLDH